MDGTDSQDVFTSNWEYAEAPENQDHIEIKNQYGLFIDGKFEQPTGKTYFQTVNPANGKVLAKVAEASEGDVDRAVKAARVASDTAPPKACSRKPESPSWNHPYPKQYSRQRHETNTKHSRPAPEFNSSQY